MMRAMRRTLVASALFAAIASSSTAYADPPQTGAPRADAPTPSVPVASSPPVVIQPGVMVREKRSLVLPVVLASVGAAAIATGAVLVATAPALPANCSGDAKTCLRLPGQSDADFASDQDRAGRADAQPTVGWLIVGAGGMLVTAGVLSYLMPSARRAASTPRVLPYAGASFGGLTAVGTF